MKKILMLAGALIISAVSFADLESTIKNHYSNKTIDLTVVSAAANIEIAIIPIKITFFIFDYLLHSLFFSSFFITFTVLSSILSILVYYINI